VSLQINASDGANSTPTVRVEFVSPKPEVELDALLERNQQRTFHPHADRRDYGAPEGPVLDAFVNRQPRCRSSAARQVLIAVCGAFCRDTSWDKSAAPNCWKERVSARMLPVRHLA
jgi:hypothetical protein